MHGKVVTVRPQAVQRRKLDRQDQTVDSEKNVIHRKQIVNVIDGPHSGRQGEVQHFHGNFVFLSSLTMLENGGIFVCKTQHLVLPGGSKGASGVTAAVGVGRSPRISSPVRLSGGRDGRGGDGAGGSVRGADDWNAT